MSNTISTHLLIKTSAFGVNTGITAYLSVTDLLSMFSYLYSAFSLRVNYIEGQTSL